jgi:hypothetical protein
MTPILGGFKFAKPALLHVEQCYAQVAAGASDRKATSAWTRKTAGIVLAQALEHAFGIKLIPTTRRPTWRRHGPSPAR